MNAQPTAWERAHQKSAALRRANALDVPAEMYRAHSGVFVAGLPFEQAFFEPSEVARRFPPRRFEFRITGALEAGRYLANGEWIAAGTDAWWQWQFRDREFRAIYGFDHRQTHPHTDTSPRPKWYGVDWGRADDIPPRPRQSAPQKPRWEDETIPYEQLTSDEKKKRATFFTERLKTILNKRADAKR